MNENGKLQNILHCTDNDTIDKIAEKYTLSDEATSQRVYERCVQKMMAKKGENSGYTEMFITEKYITHQPQFNNENIEFKYSLSTF